MTTATAVSAPISWPRVIPNPPASIESDIDAYAVIRIQKATDPLPPVEHLQARVRDLRWPSGIHGPKVLSWRGVPFHSDTKLRRELESYVHLPDDWDGEGAVAPSQAAIVDALTFLDGRPPDIPLPHPDQGSEGEVGVYWDNRDAQVFAEATFEGDGTYAYFAVHGVPGATTDKCGSDNADVSNPWPEDMLRILRKPDRA